MKLLSAIVIFLPIVLGLFYAHPSLATPFTYSFGAGTTIAFTGNPGRAGAFSDGIVTVTGEFIVEDISSNVFSESIVSPIRLVGSGAAAGVYDLAPNSILNSGSNEIILAYDNGTITGDLFLFFSGDLTTGVPGNTPLISATFQEFSDAGGSGFNFREGTTTGFVTLVPTATSEPNTFILLTSGFGLLLVARRFRESQVAPAERKTPCLP